VEQALRLHGTTCWRQRGSIAMKLSRLDACKDRRVACWCRVQASGHNSPGVVDDRINDMGVSTATPYRSAVLSCRIEQS